MKDLKVTKKNFELLTDHEKQKTNELKKFLEKGGVPTIVLFSVNVNADKRKMTFLYSNKGEIKQLDSNLINKLEGEKAAYKTHNFIVEGCGMDMALHLLQVIKNLLGVKNPCQKYNFVSYVN